jgi:class 3 adenylate cyclase
LASENGAGTDVTNSSIGYDETLVNDWGTTLRQLIRVPIRVGIHSGEVVLTAEHVRGVAVHAAARIVDEAREGEVLLSGTTRDLAEGAAGLAFDPRGRYHLKGLEREHGLFAASSTG